MRLAPPLGVLLLACVVTVPAAEQQNGRPAVVRPALPGRGGLPKAARGGAPKMPRPEIGPPLTNPASPAARLYRASAEERDRALEKLPPKLQEQLRKQLEQFDALPKPQQQMIVGRVERYAALPRERQAAIRSQLQALSALAPERRRPIVMALRQLQVMSGDERRRFLEGAAFQSEFSPEERKIIADLAEFMLPPL